MNEILKRVVDALCELEGIEAIVLGGSRARKTHDEHSDIDIGIYYNESLNYDDIERIATYLDDEHRDELLARPGEWGKWVNGGAWMVIDNHPVDIILRDINRVKYYQTQVTLGQVTAHYQTGHPHAYFNVMYVGELAICDVLWSKNDDFKRLKQEAEHYPPALKKSLLDWFQFEARFSVELARKAIFKEDQYTASAHIIRSISSLNQVLFAVNETYWINEKNAVNMIETFEVKPKFYKNRINMILDTSGSKPHQACHMLEALIIETEGLIIPA